MKKTMLETGEIVNFQEYKNKKKQLEVDRVELLNLIKKVVMSK